MSRRRYVFARSVVLVRPDLLIGVILLAVGLSLVLASGWPLVAGGALILAVVAALL